LSTPRRQKVRTNNWNSAKLLLLRWLPGQKGRTAGPLALEYCCQKSSLRKPSAAAAAVNGDERSQPSNNPDEKVSRPCR
jgi:hypothetical protein